MRSSWRSVVPLYAPVGSMPCSSLTTSQNFAPIGAKSAGGLVTSETHLVAALASLAKVSDGLRRVSGTNLEMNLRDVGSVPADGRARAVRSAGGVSLPLRHHRRRAPRASWDRGLLSRETADWARLSRRSRAQPMRTGRRQAKERLAVKMRTHAARGRVGGGTTNESASRAPESRGGCETRARTGRNRSRESRLAQVPISTRQAQQAVHRLYSSQDTTDNSPQPEKHDQACAVDFSLLASSTCSVLPPLPFSRAVSERRSSTRVSRLSKERRTGAFAFLGQRLRKFRALANLRSLPVDPMDSVRPLRP